METRLLRLDQLLERLPISRRQAYREMADGRLPYIQHGARRLFEESAVDAFVASLKAAASEGDDELKQLLGLVDETGQIDVDRIPDDCHVDLATLKRAVAERLAVA